MEAGELRLLLTMTGMGRKGHLWVTDSQLSYLKLEYVTLSHLRLQRSFEWPSTEGLCAYPLYPDPTNRRDMRNFQHS